jgi:hypothetical protein
LHFSKEDHFAIKKGLTEATNAEGLFSSTIEASNSVIDIDLSHIEENH